MSKTGLSKMTKGALRRISKRSPEILTGLGVAGMITTTILAVKATPKALILIEEKHSEMELELDEKVPVKEVVKTVWKCYIPAAITGFSSIACLIGANSVNARRNAAIATAYTISETALREYKDKVVETIGEKKEKEVRDAIAKDHIDKQPVTENEVIMTKLGDTLCYDMYSGRYFKSDINRLKKAENALNRQLLVEGYASLNDFYYDIGLCDIMIGNDLGWDSRDNLVTLEFSSQLADDGTPCVVVNFSNAPKYDYYR